MGVRSECGFCENNGPRSRGIAFFRGGVPQVSVVGQVDGAGGRGQVVVVHGAGVSSSYCGLKC